MSNYWIYKKEVQRFTKIPLQTIVAPAATSLLFMVIFTTAIGSVRTNYPLDSFKSFLFPGLIMMTIIQNAFMNNSSSILMSKVQGNIVDLLMPPLNNIEIIMASTKFLKFAISNDSGVSHMLSTNYCPLIKLFGPKDSVKFTPKLKNLITVSSSELNSDKIEDISISRVIKAIEDLD